jgi:hypothetical protein
MEEVKERQEESFSEERLQPRGHVSTTKTQIFTGLTEKH